MPYPSSTTFPSPQNFLAAFPPNNAGNRYERSRRGVLLGARFDGNPWTEVIWREGAAAVGTFSVIDICPVPIDPTPETPVAFNLTTTQATLPVGYYTLQARDADGVLGDETAPFLLPDPAIADGQPLCTIEQIDAELNRGGTAASYPEQSKVDARAVATAAFEREAGVAFSRRTSTKTVHRQCAHYLDLPDTRVTSVTAVNAGGIDWTSDQLATVYVDADAVYGLSYATAPVTVTYTHGYDETPPDVSRAIAVLAAYALKDGPYDDRGYNVTTDGGAVALVTASIAGAAFSVPEVQAALNRYRRVYAL